MNESIIVAVIIPYFQRESGILRRCLNSILSQELDLPVSFNVIIVDDDSPWPTNEELRSLVIPPGYGLQVVKRPNGGPAAARNKGLDAIPAGTDFVAFIDSDDIWEPTHIQRALSVLKSGGELYFSDHTSWNTQQGSLKTTRFFQESTAYRKLKPAEGASGAWVCDTGVAISYLVREFVAHLSSVVYRYSKLSDARFIVDLVPGEDHLFFLDLAVRCGAISFSTEIEAHLGNGINIYNSTTSWDSPGNLSRCLAVICLHKEMCRRYTISPETKSYLSHNVQRWRVVLTFVLARYLVRSRRLPPAFVQSLCRKDILSVLLLPANLVIVAGQLLLRKKNNRHPFDWIGRWTP
jgi:succinoglycan biosynthesis protein ExoW